MRRGLEAMLSRRRALLQYMRRHDFDMYAVTLARLNLKDNFAKQVRVVQPWPPRACALTRVPLRFRAIVWPG